MGVAADTALSKIHSVLPELLHRQYVDKPEWLKVPRLHRDRSARHSDEIQQTIKQQQKIKLFYQREDGEYSKRIVWPLGMVFWGRTWTLVGWCEIRHDYRMFRFERIKQLDILTENFETHDQCNLQHYWKNNTG